MKTRLKAQKDNPLPPPARPNKVSIQLDRSEVIKDLKLLHSGPSVSTRHSFPLLLREPSAQLPSQRSARRPNLKPEAKTTLAPEDSAQTMNSRKRPLPSRPEAKTQQKPDVDPKQEQKALVGLSKLCVKLMDQERHDALAARESRRKAKENLKRAATIRPAPEPSKAENPALPPIETLTAISGKPSSAVGNVNPSASQDLFLNPAAFFPAPNPSNLFVLQKQPVIQRAEEKKEVPFRRNATHVAIAFHIQQSWKSLVSMQVGWEDERVLDRMYAELERSKQAAGS